ncbi:MAG: RNA polymerase sigma factor [Acidobacteria bacterium]|nr:RNA polymerase sigma factor [Acidobacteriota bacterium]
MREEELEQLYARLERPLCNVVYRWLWNMDEAQDVVQDAFVRLWRMRARVDLVTVAPLIYKIALNLAASGRRSKRLWQWVSLDALRAPRSKEASADSAISSREEAARVRSAVQALPEQLRRLIMLCEYSELSYDEIADILSIPAGTVGSRRHRALRRLREALSEGVIGGHDS